MTKITAAFGDKGHNAWKNAKGGVVMIKGMAFQRILACFEQLNAFLDKGASPSDYKPVCKLLTMNCLENI